MRLVRTMFAVPVFALIQGCASTPAQYVWDGSAPIAPLQIRSPWALDKNSKLASDLTLYLGDITDPKKGTVLGTLKFTPGQAEQRTSIPIGKTINLVMLAQYTHFNSVTMCSAMTPIATKTGQSYLVDFEYPITMADNKIGCKLTVFLRNEPEAPVAIREATGPQSISTTKIKVEVHHY